MMGKRAGEDARRSGREAARADLPALPRTPAGGAEAVELHALLARTYDEPPAIIGGGVLPRAEPGRIRGRAEAHEVLPCQAAGAGADTRPTVARVSDDARAQPLPQRGDCGARAPETRADDAGRPRRPGSEGAVHFVTDRRLRLDRPDSLRTVRHLIEGLSPTSGQ